MYWLIYKCNFAFHFLDLCGDDFFKEQTKLSVPAASVSQIQSRDPENERLETPQGLFHISVKKTKQNNNYCHRKNFK